MAFPKKLGIASKPSKARTARRVSALPLPVWWFGDPLTFAAVLAGRERAQGFVKDALRASWVRRALIARARDLDAISSSLPPYPSASFRKFSISLGSGGSFVQQGQGSRFLFHSSK